MTGSTTGQEDYLATDPEQVEFPEEQLAHLRADIMSQLTALRLPSWAGGTEAGLLSKEGIRVMHAAQRAEILQRELTSLAKRVPHLVEKFADGNEVVPEAIDPELIRVESEGPTSNLFRLATLLWSVPVSKGYGRRMRYLVRDRSNGKIIGIFGLTDPVFNLRARDEWIGWDVEQRRVGLVHLMDAYVVGAVPPYSAILGGKLVASLIGSSEVSDAFARRYSETSGHISERRKAARLVLVTVTSALGRSSLYNRLRLASNAGSDQRMLVDLIHVGSTQGFGHFHLSEPLFQSLRTLVRASGHVYADGHQYGSGPNWRIRLARVGLAQLGLDPNMLRHGIAREIYLMPLATNYREFLCGAEETAHLDRPSVAQISSAALDRWVLPRATRDRSFASFEKASLIGQLRAALCAVGAEDE